MPECLVSWECQQPECEMTRGNSLPSIHCLSPFPSMNVYSSLELFIAQYAVQRGQCYITLMTFRDKPVYFLLCCRLHAVLQWPWPLPPGPGKSRVWPSVFIRPCVSLSSLLSVNSSHLSPSQLSPGLPCLAADSAQSLSDRQPANISQLCRTFCVNIRC